MPLLNWRLLGFSIVRCLFQHESITSSMSLLERDESLTDRLEKLRTEKKRRLAALSDLCRSFSLLCASLGESPFKIDKSHVPTDEYLQTLTEQLRKLEAKKVRRFREFAKFRHSLPGLLSCVSLHDHRTHCEVSSCIECFKYEENSNILTIFADGLTIDSVKDQFFLQHELYIALAVMGWCA